MGTASRQQKEGRTPTVECRSEPRLETSLPVRLQAGGSGITRDISATGVSFDLPQGRLEAGAEIGFSVEFEDAGGKRKWSLACAARVVRVQQADGVQQVAAKIHESRLELQR